MNPAWNALVALWDAARESILCRVDGVLSEAAAVSTPIVGGLTSDATALQRLWQPVEAKMHAMAGEVSDTWNSISDAMSEVDGIPDGGMWLEGFKRDATNTEIQVRHGRARAAVFAQAALMMKAHAERSTTTRRCRPTTGESATRWKRSSTRPCKGDCTRRSRTSPVSRKSCCLSIRSGERRTRSGSLCCDASRHYEPPPRTPHGGADRLRW